MSSIPPIGVQIPRILLPKPDSDLSKWAVIACDQFTSEPEYWQEVAALVGDAPSTYHMILPEVYLDTPEEARRLQSIRSTMHDYLAATSSANTRESSWWSEPLRAELGTGSCWRSIWSSTITAKAPPA